jgi:hypothetical protein
MNIRDFVETARLPGKGGYILQGRRHLPRKRLLTLFTLSLVLVACDTQPVSVDTVDVQFGKAEKPGKPPKPVSAELITFTGDLEGSHEVAGCCPNAGPFPAYMMTLNSPPFPDEISGEQDGNIFMNSLGRKVPGDYIVQFWWGAEPDNYFIEIRGGEKDYDNKTKVLTVTFTEEDMTVIHADDDPTEVNVTFTLTREPIG